MSALFRSSFESLVEQSVVTLGDGKMCDDKHSALLAVLERTADLNKLVKKELVRSRDVALDAELIAFKRRIKQIHTDCMQRVKRHEDHIMIDELYRRTTEAIFAVFDVGTLKPGLDYLVLRDDPTFDAELRLIEQVVESVYIDKQVYVHVDQEKLTTLLYTKRMFDVMGETLYKKITTDLPVMAELLMPLEVQVLDALTECTNALCEEFDQDRLRRILGVVQQLKLDIVPFNQICTDANDMLVQDVDDFYQRMVQFKANFTQVKLLTIEYDQSRNQETEERGNKSDDTLSDDMDED